jgi:hypothetical protein
MLVGRAERIMVTIKVVEVAGCFASSAAHFHLGFNQNVPNSPYGYGRVEYGGNRLVMRPTSNCQNNKDSNYGVFSFGNSTGMLTRKHAEPYCSPGTMVKGGRGLQILLALW